VTSLPSPELAVGLAWAVWFATWCAAAAWSDRAAKGPGFGAEALYRGVTVVGVVLLFGFGRFSSVRLWALSAAAGWAMVLAAILGFLFCWWARIHLGRLWSSSVGKKAGHRVVDTGPYGIVRHPIYTGLIAASFATALIKGTAAALAGAIVLTGSFWIKARLEERFLSAELGADSYGSYRRRVPMLIPFGPR
jgi:protein-S-isoprenylcysteine O-methyltransferase Ste14